MIVLMVIVIKVIHCQKLRQNNQFCFRFYLWIVIVVMVDNIVDQIKHIRKEIG